MDRISAPVKMSVTIDTMLNFDGGDGHDNSHLTRKQTFIVNGVFLAVKGSQISKNNVRVR